MRKSVKIGIVAGVIFAIAISMLFIPITREITTQIANPASKYCLEHGGLSAIKSSNNGTQQGICQFPNGSECDEWEYFRGQCHP